MKFQTELSSRDISVYGGECSYEGSNIRINWDVAIEFRDWGIKDVSVYVTSVEGILSIEDFEIEDYPNAPLEIDFSKWDIETNFEIGDGRPDNIEFDIKEKSIIVS